MGINGRNFNGCGLACILREGIRLNELPEIARPTLEQYLAELETFYPAAKEHTEISVDREGIVYIRVPWPKDDETLIRLSEHMAEIETKILVESGQHFMLLPTQEL